MQKTNMYSTAYGLIVLTEEKKIVLLKRKVPYCVQDFLMKNRHLNLNNYEKSFQNYFKTLDFQLKIDYINFRNNLSFEDEYDFPHGQMELNTKKLKYLIEHIQMKSKSNTSVFKFYAFITAIREFKEETGYSFQLQNDLNSIPICKSEFVGLDGYFYQQIYFIIKVKNLEVIPNLKIDDYHKPIIMDLPKAIEIFNKQQKIKVDKKNLLLKQYSH